jgi:HAD superfamily hydrolase (TIGR01509 family)
VSRKPARADAPGGDATPLEAVLLDIDGTLLDSNDAHAQAWSDALREAGFDIGSEVVRPLIGMGGDKLLPDLTGIDAESEGGKRLIERRKEIFAKEYLPAVRPFPNANDLLDRLRADGLKLVVATSASDDELHGLLEALGDKSLLEDATSSSDADRSKPDPDIIHAAVAKAETSAAACVMLGDTPYDVEAATKGGVQIIALRCGGWGDDSLAGAAEVHDDPKAVLEHYDETLIGRRLARTSADDVRRTGAADRPRRRDTGKGEGESHAKQ